MQLRDRAWTITQDIDHTKLTRRDGSVCLLEGLRDRLGRSPIPDIGIRLEELIIKLRRLQGMAMSTWFSHVQQTYERVQVALHRARKEQGPSSPTASPGRLPDFKKTSRPSSPSSSRKGKTSPTRRSSEATQDENQAEGTIPPVPEASDEDAFGEDEPDPDRGLDAKQSWRKRLSKRKDEDDDDESDTSADMMKDLEV